MKLSTEDVASALGVQPRTLADFETGRRRITAERLFSFCQILEIKPAQIYGGAPVDEPAAPVFQRTVSSAA